AVVAEGLIPGLYRAHSTAWGNDAVSAEIPALPTIGGHRLDQCAPTHQVHLVEAFHRLPRLGVPQPHARTDRSAVAPARVAQRSLHLAGTFGTHETCAVHRRGQPGGNTGPGGQVPAAEGGHASPCRSAHHVKAEVGGGPGGGGSL